MSAESTISGHNITRQAGLAVRRLQRVREHTLTLGDLPVGQWRYLTQQELRDLEGSEKS